MVHYTVQFLQRVHVVCCSSQQDSHFQIMFILHRSSCWVNMRVLVFFSCQVSLLVPVCYLLFWALLLGFSLHSDPLVCGVGLVIMLTGVPVYFLGVYWKDKPKCIYDFIGKETFLVFVFCRKQNEIFCRMSMLLFSIQLQKYKQVANKHYKVVHLTPSLLKTYDSFV